ncbi:MAG: helix-turn-helix transcriptional regulator [Clostridia bacterium]|nr:helix-turn-helix transcriptional regulator [Clostridia bacterium]
MLQENIRAFRQKKGMTQEELALRLHVVRQTVSKWEKGLSVPDAELLIRLAEVLEVSVAQLLGGEAETATEEKPDAMIEQLSRINEQLAIKNRRAKRLWKIVAWILGAIAVLIILNIGFGVAVFGVVS